VDALDILAYPHTVRALPVRAFLDAGRRRYATALYKANFHRLERVGALQSVSDDSMAGLVTEPTICCGELSSVARDALSLDAGSAAIFASPANSIRRAANLAELAWQRWQAGDEAASLTDAIYVSGEQA
jgi:hypothetical protein